MSTTPAAEAGLSPNGEPLPQVGYRELFRTNRNFRRLFTARTISLFGDWFNMLAVLALLREMGEDGASSFGLILIAKTLPALFAAPLAGVVVDRFSRRAIMIGTDLGRAAVVLCMLGCAALGSVSLLYGLVVVQALLASLFEPARSALLPDIVSKRELTAANAIGAAMWSTMLTIGAACGGVVAAKLGWQVAIGVDAFTYLVSATVLLRVFEPKRARMVRDQTGWRGGLADVREGFAYVIERPRVLTLMLVKFGWCLAGSITLVLTLLGERIFLVGGDPLIGVTIFYVARGLGTGMGPILSRHYSNSVPAAMERAILYGFGCGALFYFLLAFAPNLILAAIFVCIAHLGGATIWVFSTVRLQQLVPTEVRGRVFAVEQACFTCAYAVSTGVYGLAIDGEWVDLRVATAMLGLSLLVPTLGWLARGWRLGWAHGCQTHLK